MSNNYRNSKEVLIETLIARLRELSDAVAGGRQTQEREFTMRIPAECDRDADIILEEAAKRLARAQGDAEPQVMGRVAHLDSGAVICQLNSIGRSLPDHTPLYARQPAAKRVVPDEPTDAMLEAAMSERDKQSPANAKRYLRHVWQKMLSAAPTPSQGLDKKSHCKAVRCNDQMMCQCGLAWDVDDPEPPECGKAAR